MLRVPSKRQLEFICPAISLRCDVFPRARSSFLQMRHDDAEALFMTRIIDRRSRKWSRSRWHGPPVAIIEDSKAETASLALPRNRDKGITHANGSSPDISFARFSSVPESRDAFRKRYYSRWIFKCSGTKTIPSISELSKINLENKLQTLDIGYRDGSKINFRVSPRVLM